MSALTTATAAVLTCAAACSPGRISGGGAGHLADEADADADTVGDADAGAGSAPGDSDAGGAPQPAWTPPPGTSWQWQLTGAIDTGVDVAMYDVDLFEAPDAAIETLHADGRVVICYFSAGSLEDWRDDAADIPADAVGDGLDGWPGEYWLDVRHPGVRAVMVARLDLAVARGCDGVEPDNVDGYDNASGFSLTAADQLDYNRFLAREAHGRGLSVGLKNDLAQVEDLVGEFDWALNEECFAWDECDALAPFIDAGKAVFQVEYGGASLSDQVCPTALALGFSTLVKRADLDAWRVACE